MRVNDQKRKKTAQTMYCLKNTENTISRTKREAGKKDYSTHHALNKSESRRERKKSKGISRIERTK